MRTKQTGKRDSVAGGQKANNGLVQTPKTPQSTAGTQSLKSPGQPQKLSEADEAKLRDFLNRNEKPFNVTIVPLSRKRKRAGTPLPVQTDLFQERLNVSYEVKPANNWESLRRYKKFTVGSESMAVGECILVKHEDSADPKIDISEQWKAKVLEVRALDSEHVYLRVAWLNRPEDLDTGRKAYHGKNELIPTNQMDIIDAMAVNGRLDVQYWDDADDESVIMGEDTYFWRQTLDFANTKTFSKLRHICVDNAPQNPDELILQCSNAGCRKWLHVKCIAEDAVRTAAEGAQGEQQMKGSTKQTTKTKGASRKRKLTSSAKKEELVESDVEGGENIGPNPTSSAQAVARLDTFTAEVFIKDLFVPGGANDPKGESTEIIVTDGDGVQHSQTVKCLFCQHEIE